MERWLEAALDYVPRWLEFQMRASQQPGCIVAIAHRDKIVLERAYGHANLATGEALTPRHRFRVASHSKSFTAAGVLKLREQGRLGLDDTAGRFVSDLHPRVASATIAQLLSHSAGLVRDGADAGQFVDRRPFLSPRELAADLTATPILDGGARFKYSNHGYGLIGLIIEALVGEPYTVWIEREIVDAAGLRETLPDMPLPRGTRFARGHSGRILLGKRLVIPGENVAHAMAPAAGFVSTAADLARFFSQLSPSAKRSVLSGASRREMTRRQWRNPHSSLEQYYGHGTMSGASAGWEWFGHTGGLQGYISSTRTYPGQDVTISVLTNALDGWATVWTDGLVNIMQTFSRNGAPSRKVRDWAGRWWSLWGASDLVPMGDKVLVVGPGFTSPFTDASEITISGRDTGRIALAAGYASHGEPVRRVRARSKRISAVWLGGTKLLPAAQVAREMQARYGRVTRRAPKRRRRA